MAQDAYNIKSCKKWWLAARPSASSFPEQSHSLCPPGKPSSLQRITFPEQARSVGKSNELCLNVLRSIPVRRSSTIGVYLCAFEQRHKGDMAGKITSMSKIKQVLIMVDGIKLIGKFNEKFDLSQIPASGIERIEIIKGASSAMYGSEAMGGVVNIITKAPKDYFT